MNWNYVIGYISLMEWDGHRDKPGRAAMAFFCRGHGKYLRHYDKWEVQPQHLLSVPWAKFAPWYIIYRHHLYIYTAYIQPMYFEIIRNCRCLYSIQHQHQSWLLSSNRNTMTHSQQRISRATRLKIILQVILLIFDAVWLRIDCIIVPIQFN